jgi:WD40 repeat protein
MNTSVKSVLVLEDDNVAVGDASPTISIWNSTAKSIVKKLTGHAALVVKLIKLKHQTIASGSADASIIIWNCTNGRLLKNLTGHGDVVNDLVFLNSNESLASCSDDSTTRIWSIKSGQELRRLTSSSPVFSLSLFETNHLAGGLNGAIRIWNVNTGKTLKDFLIKKYFKCFTFLENGLLASGYYNIEIRNVTSGVLIQSLNERHLLYVVDLLELRKNYLASTSLHMKIQIWNLESGMCVKTLKGHSGQISSLVLFKNANLMSGSLDKTVKMWNLASVFGNSVEHYVEYGEL